MRPAQLRAVCHSGTTSGGKKGFAWIACGNWPTSQSIAYGKFETTNYMSIRRSDWRFRLDKIEVLPEEAVVSSDDLRVTTTVYQTKRRGAHGCLGANLDHRRLRRVSFAQNTVRNAAQTMYSRVTKIPMVA